MQTIYDAKLLLVDDTPDLEGRIIRKSLRSTASMI